MSENYHYYIEDYSDDFNDERASIREFCGMIEIEIDGKTMCFDKGEFMRVIAGLL